MRRAAALAVLFTVACAGGVRHFKDQPIVWSVDDARDIPLPADHPFLDNSYFAEVFLFRRLDRGLELRVKQPARDTNALDEVPDSTWFTNRLGRRVVTPAEAAAATAQPPPKPPYRVSRGKSEGSNPGFFMKDATDRTFLVKFDTLENPEMQTANDAIVDRVLWTIGFNVPSDHVFVFRRDELTIAPDAKIADALGEKRPMTAADLDKVLATSPRTAAGAYRATSSEILGGVPRGGAPPEGVRADDPNDRVPHEQRRELRGLRVISAWLSHTDMKEDNFLDMYIKTDGGGYLRHYMVDFGETLGGHQSEKDRLEDGWEYTIDWGMQMRSLLSFGLWKRHWEGQKLTPWPAVGYFAASHFDPREWRPAYPYWPFLEMDAADAYWGAKLVMRFDRPMLEAIMVTAQLSDPAAAAYLVDVLLERRDQVGRAYLDDVTALDELRLAPGQLCGVDLVARYHLGRPAVLERLDAGDRVISRAAAAPDGAVCLPLDDGPDYTVARLRFRRDGDVRPVLQVHFKGGATPRILGIVRVED